MKRVSKLIIYGFIALAIAFLINFTNIYPLTATSTNQQTQTTIPKRLNITVSISEPDDLKISEGSLVKTGDVIADRERERTRLQAQEKQLQLSLDRLSAASITSPAAPQPVPPSNGITACQLPRTNRSSREDQESDRISRIGSRTQTGRNYLFQERQEFRPHYPRTRTSQTQTAKAESHRSSQRISASNGQITNCQE